MRARDLIDKMMPGDEISPEDLQRIDQHDREQFHQQHRQIQYYDAAGDDMNSTPRSQGGSQYQYSHYQQHNTSRAPPGIAVSNSKNSTSSIGGTSSRAHARAEQQHKARLQQQQQKSTPSASPMAQSPMAPVQGQDKNQQHEWMTRHEQITVTEDDIKPPNLLNPTSSAHSSGANSYGSLHHWDQM